MTSRGTPHAAVAVAPWNSANSTELTCSQEESTHRFCSGHNGFRNIAQISPARVQKATATAQAPFAPAAPRHTGEAAIINTGK